VVTGGAGAIGSRLVRRLIALDAAEVVVIDDLSSGYRWLLPDDHRLRFVEADVVDIASRVHCAHAPIVFHLAALFANQNSIDHPDSDLHTNGLGTLRTLMWAEAVQAERVVYASAGCSIAGHNVDEPIREDMPVSLFLDTPYQITKALGEFYCNYFGLRVETVRCRFFNSYGPGEVPGPYRNVIPNFIWNAMHDAPLTVTGTGDETRDFIFVDDLVDGLVRCATGDAAGEAFNLGTGRETRVVDLANLIREVVGSKSEIVFHARRPWDHSLRRQADISKAHARLGFAAQTGLRRGLEATVEWFRANRAAIAAAVGAR
jgi:nucleoside-diphosphate-sugar epimerase